MPAFPERESSILAVLKRKKPGRVPDNEIREAKTNISATINNHVDTASVPSSVSVTNAASTDLLGLSTPPAAQPTSTSNTGVLLDVFGEMYGPPQSNALNNGQAATYNTKK